ncbi:hypothetical protein JCM15519_28060 [Fundidesulfovibrio butyratiphilus]
MRITYRQASNKDYWTRRWAAVEADDASENPDGYPLKYARITVEDEPGRVLEAGCGAGRVLRAYHDRGRDIVGMDFVESACAKLKRADQTLRLSVADILRLPFQSGAFRHVLAFGLYHNLETGLDQALAETRRVLQPGGRVCASFRADNFQTRLTDWLAAARAPSGSRTSGTRCFHKANLTRQEFTTAFERAGFAVESLFPVENMPIFYKFAMFRAQGHKVFDENMARREGYRLSRLGQILQDALMRFFPDQFCNIYVIVARKPAGA